MTLTQISTAGVKDDAVTAGKIPANAVGSSELADNAVNNAAVASNAAIDVSKLSGVLPLTASSSNSLTGDLHFNKNNPLIKFTNNNSNPDYYIGNIAGTLKVRDTTNAADRLLINTDGHIDVKTNLDCEAGLDVTGNITGTGDLTIDTNTLKVDSSNNRVGIGTTSPQHDLDILKTGSGDDTSFRVGSTASSGDNDATIVINNGGSGDASLRFDYESSASRCKIYTNSSTNDLIFDTDGNETMRLKADHKVGIGTSSPTARFDVRRSDADGKIAEFHQSTGYGIEIGSSQSEAYIASGHSQGFVFKSNPGTGITERMRIDSSGKVGIGETTPLAQLHIKPTSNIKQLLLEQNNATDGYGLMQDGPNGGHLKFLRHINGSDTQTLLLRSGGGLCFGTDSAAANALDDYEEGSYTPVMTYATDSGNKSYSNQYGLYTKIGRKVTCVFIMQIANKGTGSGEIRISLPFAVPDLLAGTSLEAGGLFAYYYGLTSSVSSINMTAVSGGSTVRLDSSKGQYSTSTAPLQFNEIGNDLSLRGAITYFVA